MLSPHPLVLQLTIGYFVNASMPLALILFSEMIFVICLFYFLSWFRIIPFVLLLSSSRVIPDILVSQSLISWTLQLAVDILTS